MADSISPRRRAWLFVAAILIARETLDFMLSRIFFRENIWAILLCLIVIALIIFTADNSPAWIYQGF